MAPSEEARETVPLYTKNKRGSSGTRVKGRIKADLGELKKHNGGDENSKEGRKLLDLRSRKPGDNSGGGGASKKRRALTVTGNELHEEREERA